MAPNINNPGGVKNDPDEIRDGVVSDATRFPGGFIDQRITDSGAPVDVAGKFNVSNGSVVESFSVSSQTTKSQDIALKPDGSRMYVAGSSSANIYQYDLSTAFDVSTASLDTTFSVSSEDGNPFGLDFKPDGTEMFITGLSNRNVYQYSLSTGFDVSTASFSQSFNVNTQTNTPQAVTFRPDGTQMYVPGTTNDNVYQYSLSTGFDISTASFTLSFDVSPQTGTPTGIDLKPDGSQLYVGGNSIPGVIQYSLSTAFDISTASLNQTLDVTPQVPTTLGITLDSGGSQLYVLDGRDDTVFQFSVGSLVGAVE